MWKSPETDTSHNVMELIVRKRNNPTDVRLDREIFIRGISVLRDLPCIWCTHKRIAGELLRLLSFPENECLCWFRERTIQSLSSCSECLEAYYCIRPQLREEFAQIFEVGTLELFWDRVKDFDAARIERPLRDFLEAKIDSKSMELLFALYELFLFPDHLKLKTLHGYFSQTLTRLISSKKMIRLNRLLPGIIVCLFDNVPAINQWARSVIEAGDIEKVDDFPAGSLDLLDFFQHVNYSSTEEFASLVLISRWLPKNLSSSALVAFLRPLIKSLTFPDRTLPSFSAINACLADHIKVPAELWNQLLDAMFETVFSEDTCPKLGVTDFLWINALRSWSISHSNMSTIMRVYEKSLPQLMISDNVNILKTYTRIISALTSGTIISQLVPRHSQQVYRVVSACVHKLRPGCEEDIPVAVDLVLLCLELDRQVLLETTPTNDFRGFAQLLDRIFKTKSSNQMIVNEFIKSIANGNFDINLLLTRRQFLTNLISEGTIDEIFCSSPEVAGYALLFMCTNTSRDSEGLKILLQSYPNVFIDGFALFLDLIKSITETSQRLMISSETIVLFLNSFCTVFFLDSSTTIVDLFPAKITLLRKTIGLGLYTAQLLFNVHDSEELGKDMVRRLERILEFTSRINVKLKSLGCSSIGKYDSLNCALLSKIFEVFCKSACAQARDSTKMICNILVLLVECSAANSCRLTTLVQKIFGILLTTHKFDTDELSLLNKAIDEYEKKAKALLPRPPADIKSLELPVKRLREVVDVDLEERILENMNTALAKHKERSMPQTLKSSMIPIIARPITKFEQLRAEAIRDAPPPIPTRKKQILGPAKRLQRLDEAGSSASETDSDLDFGTVRKEFIKTTANDHVAGRSVKLIDITDDTSIRKPSAKSESLAIIQEANLIKQFHRAVLHFDLHDIETLPENSSISNVPGTFTDSADYISVFEPLLLMESRAQLAQSREDSANDEIQSLRIGGVAHVDNFHEVILQEDVNSDENRMRLNDQDYLLVYFEPQNETLTGVIVQAGIKSGTFEVIVRLSIPNAKAALQIELREGLRLKFRKIGNVITNLREYTAMHLVSQVSLAQHIFSPKLNSLQGTSIGTELAGMIRELDINMSQARAITAVIQKLNPFTLIQGPPGTGKTKTIEALLGVLLGQTWRGTNKPKVLICAPSNAAIDEIVRRIRHGLMSGSGQRFLVKVLRIGSLDMISDAVKDLTLDSQADVFLESCAGSSTKLLESQRKSCDELRKTLRDAERAHREDQVKSLKTSLWEVKENMRKNAKFIEDTRSTAKRKILNEAQIVCCTLSSSGHEVLAKIEFEYLIIDEACQAVELSCLVPLQHNCKQCVLVGDPNQLPPTVISQMAGVFSYEQSLFVRLQKQCPESVLLLDTQYRMHPEISRFPNSYFYEGKLVDGPTMFTANRRPWHSNPMLSPFKFFDVSGQEGTWKRDSGIESKSKLNELEARIAANLVAMIAKSADGDMIGKIGIVTPYKDQRRALRKEIIYRFGSRASQAIEISTIDGFQGQEREVIIFSCVRTGESRGIGFLNDTRRLNVALTRAKCSLFILGKSSALVRNPIWKAMIEDAKARHCLVSMWEDASRIGTLPNLTLPSKVDSSSSAALVRKPLIKGPTTIQTAAQRGIINQQHSNPRDRDTSVECANLKGQSTNAKSGNLQGQNTSVKSGNLQGQGTSVNSRERDAHANIPPSTTSVVARTRLRIDDILDRRDK